MEKDEERVSDGLNQLVDIINAKGDEGELREIVDRNNTERVNKTDLPDKI